MSKITNDGLTRSSTVRMLHSCTHMATVDVKGLRQTRCTSKPDLTNLHQVDGWWAAFTGVETRLWPTVDHLDPPDLPRHGCNSERGPASSGGQTVLANDRNGGSLRLNASRHDDVDAEFACCFCNARSIHVRPYDKLLCSLIL